MRILHFHSLHHLEAEANNAANKGVNQSAQNLLKAVPHVKTQLTRVIQKPNGF